MTSGPAEGQSLEVDDELVIGREGADVTIADPELSRRHARVRPVERGVAIEDLGSLNGTFVNGRRISEEVTLTTGGMIKLGVSEIAIELALADVTKPGAIMPAPDVTAPRAIPGQGPPEPDVTVPRAMPAPAPPAPDVTAPRAMPGAAPPEQPPGPPPQAPPGAQPPPGEGRPQASGAPPAGPPGGPPPGRPRRGPRPQLIGLGLLLVAAVLAIIIFVATREEETERRVVNANLRTSSITNPNRPRVVFAGLVTGQPFGEGNATIDQVFGGNLADGRPVPVRGTVTLRFEDGTVDGRLRATATPQRNSVDVEGRVPITGGTGEFEGIEGALNMTGGRPDLDQPNAEFDLRGEVEY